MFTLVAMPCATLVAQAPRLDTLNLMVRFETVPRITSPPMRGYPEHLRRAGLGGRVLLQVVVGPAGVVEKGAVVVLSAGEPRLGPFARTIAQELTWEPGRIQGKPVTGVVMVPIEFGMKERIVTWGPVGLVDDVVLPGHWADVKLRVVTHPEPAFLDSLRRAGAAGTADVEFIIGRDGVVEPASIVVYAPTPPEFAPVAVEIVKRARFTPPQVGGRPSRVVGNDHVAVRP